MIDALFECASCQTQGSLVETVYEVVAAGPFLFWALYLACLFKLVTVQGLVSKQLLINVFNLRAFLYLHA